MKYFDASEKSLVKAFDNLNIELEIPSYLDANEVNEVLEGAKILWYEDNDHNFCVLAAWPDEDSPFNTMFYFSRFFNICNKTVVSHDATGHSVTDMLVQLSKLANKYYQ